MTQPISSSKWNPLAVVLLISSAFFAFFLVVSGALYMMRPNQGANDPSSKKSMSATLFGSGSVGIIEMNGEIFDSKKTLKKLEQFSESKSIKAVVLRLNSPGGAVAPSQEIFEAVKKFKKPLVVSMGSVAASGAFYIACGAKKVWANPGTITGSIGVIMQFTNLSKLYEWAKVSRYSIKTGKFKDAGADYRDLTDEDRALLQAMVDDVLLQFKTAIAEGRNLPMDKVTAIADGRIFSGSQAKTLKLVDELGTIDDAIMDAAKLGGIKGKPKLVYSDKKKPHLVEWLMEDLDRKDGDEDASSSSSFSGLNVWSGVMKSLARNILGFSDDSLESDKPLGRLTIPSGLYWIWQGL